MTSSGLVNAFRRLILMLLLAGSTMFGAQTCSAAEAPAPITVIISPGQSPSEVDAAIKAAAQDGRPVLIQMQGQPAVSSSSAASATPKSAAAKEPTQVTTMGEMWMVNDLWAALSNGISLSLNGLAGLPAAFSASWSTLSAESDGPERALGFSFVAVLCAAVLTYIADLLVKLYLQRHQPKQRFLLALLRLMTDAMAISIFMGVSHLILRASLQHGSFTREVAGALVATVNVVLIYAAIGRFFLRPSLPGAKPLLRINNPNWHFSMLVAYGALNAFTSNSVRLADIRMVAADAADSWLFLTVSVLTLLKLYWFIAGRQDIADAFTGNESSGFRRLIGHFLADFYAISAVLIWATGLLVAGTTQNLVWARAAPLTQFLLVTIPIIDHGIFALFGALAKKREAANGPGLPSVVLWTMRAPIAGAVWLIGLHLIVIQWQPMMMGAASLVTTWLVWLERISLALIASWTLCSFLIKYFEAIAPVTRIVLPGQEDDEANRRETSRLTTILPIVRNLILGAVIAVAGLVVISTAGVDVAPLLAGFGVLGLAFSFGSQSLVKDIVSGIFFLAEDAFRIGEYIDTGKLMGTVEQITIRSVRLRHHNGPIHTIPFGQIASVTNYSRDWGTTKFELRFDRDADPELIRKTAKKVGLALLEDPEYGPEFLVPLKMQGIQNVTENSLIVRFKFTARPGKPSLLKREGMKRLLVAFKAAGLPLASNAVTVRPSALGTSGLPGAEAAAASAVITPIPANQG